MFTIPGLIICAAFAFAAAFVASAINETLFQNKNNEDGFKSAVGPVTTLGLGAVPTAIAATTVAEERGSNVFHQTVITCTATPLVLTDEVDTVVYGGVKVYTMPFGACAFLGAVINGSITAVDVLATFDGDVALGSITATTGATLAATEQDILATTAITQAVAKVANCDAHSLATILTETGARYFAGTTTAATATAVFLNFVIDEDAANATSTGAFTGVITLNWLNLGDY